MVSLADLCYAVFVDTIFVNRTALDSKIQQSLRSMYADSTLPPASSPYLTTERWHFDHPLSDPLPGCSPHLPKKKTSVPV